MVIINGSNPALVSYLTGALRGRGHDLTAVAQDAHLFSEVTERGASAAIAVDAGSTDDTLLRSLTGAASSPAMPLVIYVTDRVHDDPPLIALRKSGAPYVIVRVGHIPAWSLDADLSEQTIYLSEELPVPEHGVTTGPMIVDAIHRVLTDDVAVGTDTWEACFHDGAWTEALGTLGARVVPVNSLRMRFARWRKRPCLVDQDGTPQLLNVPARSESVAPLEGASGMESEGGERGRYTTAA